MSKLKFPILPVFDGIEMSDRSFNSDWLRPFVYLLTLDLMKGSPDISPSAILNFQLAFRSIRLAGTLGIFEYQTYDWLTAVGAYAEHRFPTGLV